MSTQPKNHPRNIHRAPSNVLPFERPRGLAEILATDASVEIHPRGAADTDAFTVTLVRRAARNDPGTTTLMGVGARAVRATSRSGWIEAKPATAPLVLVAAAAPAPAPAPPRVPAPAPEPAPAANTNEGPDPGDSLDHMWEPFDRIGLGAPKKASGGAAKAVVSVYRLLGFGVLTLIVAVLVGYIATTVFYFLSHSWIMPVAVSKHDEKVIALQSQLADQQNQLERLTGDLADTERAIVAQQEFQSEFAKAIRTDLRGRQSALGHVRELARAAAATRSQIRATNEAYAADHANRMRNEYDAGLIDRSTMLSGKQQLAQITTSNLSLAEHQAELDQRAAQLGLETRALDDLLANKTGAALSYDVLKIKRDYDASKLELQKAMSSRKILQGSIARQQTIIDATKRSSYLRALNDNAAVALVPYDNLEHVSPGTKVMACRLSMVVCREVGRVLEVLPGEVTFRHPHRDLTVRGQMIELRMSEPDASSKDVLFLGGAPLLF